ncbi:MAG: HigA family addiction module antidote protein [Deltaproteobacteria bacterium]|nr:HigA family addiction module antidote protein [Deltaproteobacteria bacterium]
MSGPRRPPHPGQLLAKTVLPRLGVSISQAARELGVTRQTLHRLMAAQVPVTPGIALRLGRYSGRPAELWLLLQQAHDLWHSRRVLRSQLTRIPSRG